MGAEERRKPEGFAEFLFNELRYALRDIRQKVVEEGWFIRIVTAPDEARGPEPAELYGDDLRPAWSAGAEATPERRMSFEERWAVKDGPEAPADIGKEHGIDI